MVTLSTKKIVGLAVALVLSAEDAHGHGGGLRGLRSWVSIVVACAWTARTQAVSFDTTRVMFMFRLVLAHRAALLVVFFISIFSSPEPPPPSPPSRTGRLPPSSRRS